MKRHLIIMDKRLAFRSNYKLLVDDVDLQCLSISSSFELS
jgi:hypothetical protein